MSLIDDLREVLDSIPPSHVPTLQELAGIVGALLLHLDHGNDLKTAAEQGGQQGVAELIQPPVDQEAEAEKQRQADEAERQQLYARIAALEGSQGHPTVEVTPGDNEEHEG